MSFCAAIKKELTGFKNPAKHCDIAEVSAYTETAGYYAGDWFIIKTDNINLAQRAGALFSSLGIEISVCVTKKKPAHSRQYIIRADKRSVSDNICNITPASPGCCKKAYIRGAFLSCALIADPEKIYHAEFILQNKQSADNLLGLLRTFGEGAKVSKRGGYYSVYIKDSDAISDLLKIIEAGSAVVELESVRVMRDFNNNTNRRANCDLANYDKTASASANMVLDIEYIIKTRGLKYLPEPLRELAVLRLNNTEATLAELGEMMRPVLTKSAVNHRFRKISKIAQGLRG